MTGPAMLLLLAVCCRRLGPSVNLLGQSFTYVLCIWLYETHQQAPPSSPSLSLSPFLPALTFSRVKACCDFDFDSSICWPECFKLLPKRYTNLSSGQKFKAANTIICHAPHAAHKMLARQFPRGHQRGRCKFVDCLLRSP